MTTAETLGLLIFGHALADYPLQTDFLAKGKNHKSPIAGYEPIYILAMHSVIHAGFVGIITGSLELACCEFLMHCFIDYVKCDGGTTFLEDQALHIICKFIWVLLLPLL